MEPTDVDSSEEDYEGHKNNTDKDSNSKGSQTTKTLVKGKWFEIAVVAFLTFIALLFLATVVLLIVLVIQEQTVEDL